MNVQEQAQDIHVVQEQVLSDRRMEISRTEREWALRIKAAVEDCPEIDNLTDFEYVQLALSTRNDVGEALEKAQHMQAFHQEYGVLNTIQQGREMVSKNLQLLPGVALSLSYYHRDGNYVFVYDIAAFDCKKALATMQSTRILLAGCLYMCHAQCPDFTAIRQGSVLLCECSGFDWKKNMDFATFRKMWTELLAVYPMHYSKIKYFNSGVLINLINSLKKRFLPKEITDRMETGCRLDGRLSDIYMVPTPAACVQRFLARIDESLTRRFHNVQTFRLEPLRDE